MSGKLRAAHRGVFVSGSYTEAPAKFPAVTIVEADNRVATRYAGNKIEKAVRVMYEVQCYSNRVDGKKAEAKAIAATADTAFEELGFTRTFKQQVANLNNATIYRIVCRYEGVVMPNDDGKIYIYNN